MNKKYAFGKMVPYSFDVALEKVIQELAKEGFGIISKIDVSAILKNKLNQDLPPYQILGACNPQLSSRALEIEPSVGVFLPCNVVIRQDNTGKIYIEFMDPNTVLELIGNSEIVQIATEAKQRLERVMNAL